jgi:hypothetical protein
MADRRGTHNSDIIIQNLKKQAQDLKSINAQLRQELHKAQMDNRPSTQLRQAAIFRSRRHERSVDKLNTARWCVTIGTFFVVFFSLCIYCQVGASYTRKNEAVPVLMRNLMNKYFSSFDDPRITNTAVGFIGFIISIVGQFTYAPGIYKICPLCLV